MTTRAKYPILRRVVLALPILFIGWLAVLTVVMRLGGQAPGAFVPMPSPGFIASLPEDVSITGRSIFSVTLQSDKADLPKRLYAAGAMLVLPAGLDACIPNFLAQPLDEA